MIVKADPHPPTKPMRQPRVTQELREMDPGDYVDCDHAVADALVQWGKRAGWKMTRRTQANRMIRVWRMS